MKLSRVTRMLYGMAPGLEHLRTESDVEQKLVWPLLTEAPPAGLGYSPVDLVTKLSTRRLEIGKGATRKLTSQTTSWF